MSWNSCEIDLRRYFILLLKFLFPPRAWNGRKSQRFWEYLGLYILRASIDIIWCTVTFQFTQIVYLFTYHCYYYYLYFRLIIVIILIPLLTTNYNMNVDNRLQCITTYRQVCLRSLRMLLQLFTSDFQHIQLKKCNFKYYIIKYT